MDSRKTTVQRAFELASSGRVGSIADLKRALDAEGRSVSQVTGPHMLRQLRSLIQAAQDKKNADRT